MAYKEVFWMACDSIEPLRAEYGPFHTRDEAEAEAKKLGFGYLLRYEHLIDANDEIQDVRCIFLELHNVQVAAKPSLGLHTRCATCGESFTLCSPWFRCSALSGFCRKDLFPPPLMTCSRR